MERSGRRNLNCTVRRSELVRTLGIPDDDFDFEDIDIGDIEDIAIPDGIPLRVDKSLVSEPELKCKWCDKPIKGKYIKFSRRDADGTKVAIVGPFCSAECADRFGR